MTSAELKTEITTGPLAAELVPFYAARDVAEVHRRLHLPRYDTVRSAPIAEILRWAAAGGIVTKLEAGSAHPTVGDIAKVGLRLLSHPKIESLDLTDPEIIGMLDALVATAVLTQADKDGLVARATVQISRVEQLNWTVTEDDVNRAY